MQIWLYDSLLMGQPGLSPANRAFPSSQVGTQVGARSGHAVNAELAPSAHERPPLPRPPFRCAAMYERPVAERRALVGARR